MVRKQNANTRYSYSSKKSKTCYSSTKGTPLSAYCSLPEAEQAADYANITYKSNLVPYKCAKCKDWHLSPADRQTPSKTCTDCISANGKPKELYTLQKDAKARAKILNKEQQVKLYIYKCPYNSGWHLTKSKLRR